MPALHPSQLSPPDICPDCQGKEWQDHERNGKDYYSCTLCGYSLRSLAPKLPALTRTGSKVPYNRLCLRCGRKGPETSNHGYLCPNCRDELQIPEPPQTVEARDQIFPLCRAHGSMSTESRALVDMLLPVALEEGWTVTQLAKACKTSGSTASRIYRFYCRNLITAAAKKGNLALVAEITDKLRIESLAVKGEALGLGRRQLSIVESLTAALEDNAAELLDSDRVPSSEEIAPILGMVASAGKSLASLYRLISEASGQTAIEKLQHTAKAKSAGSVGTAQQPSRARPKFRVIDSPP